MSSEILQKGCSFGFLDNTATAVLLQIPYIFAVDQEDLLKASSPYMLKKSLGLNWKEKGVAPMIKNTTPK